MCPLNHPLLVQLRPMLKLQLGRDPTDQEVNGMMKEFDINKDGKISFDEYVTGICGNGWTEASHPPQHPC